MRILVLSDSHGDLTFLKKKVKKLGELDRVLHLGDYAEDGEKVREITGLPVDVVRGNNDFFGNYDNDKVIHVGEVKIFMTHGHKYGVYMGTDRLYYKGIEVGADLVLYGHTHFYDYEKIGDLTILNPGSISLPRDGRPSMVLLKIEGKKIEVERISA